MPILWESRSFSERVDEETTKTSARDCTRPRLQRPGHIPANDQVNGENDMDYDEGSDDNSKPITVVLGTITS